MTTKILALTDALGNLVRFVLLPGHRFDTVGVPPLIDGLSFGGLIADKAFDSNAIIADLNERGAKVVIAQHPRRASPLPLDMWMSRLSHTTRQRIAGAAEAKSASRKATKSASVRVSATLPPTLPVTTSKWAISVWVPWRTYWNSRRSTLPGRMGRDEAMRSSAWMPVISSTATVRTVCLAAMALRYSREPQLEPTAPPLQYRRHCHINPTGWRQPGSVAG